MVDLSDFSLIILLLNAVKSNNLIRFEPLEQRQGLNLPSTLGSLSKFSSLSRITNGKIADNPEQYHFMVGMAFNLPGLRYEVACGGTLINPLTVVTAAHCFKQTKGNGFIVYHGVIDFDNRKAVTNDKIYYTEEVKIHPKYTGIQVYDVAVVKLNRPISMKTVIKLDDGTIGSDPLHKVSVIGWGKTSYESQTPSNVLRQADLQIADIRLCQVYMKLLTNKTIHSDIHVCALDFGGQSDACQHDSGGPLISRICGKWTLVGIVSYGIFCGTATVPGIYTKISGVRDFIEQFKFI